MVKKGRKVSDFDHSMVVDPRQAGLNISEMLISWDFQAKQRESCEKKISEWQFCGVETVC